MTDKGMAVEYVRGNTGFSTKEPLGKIAVRTYLAGLKAGIAKLRYCCSCKKEQNIALKQQIEKMKCCGNCEHFNFNKPNYCHKGVYRERQYVCSEWEFGN